MDARTYQEVKKELEARREAQRVKLARAELEAADEIAEIERLEKINQTRAPSELFERLPQELRDQIWGYCVAPGKIFLSKTKIQYDTRFNDFDDYEKPHYALLAVSRSIRKQAAKVLFEQNQIIFPYDAPGFDIFVGANMQYVGDLDDEINIHLATLARKYLRSVSITFDLRFLVTGDALETAADMRAHDPGAPGTSWSNMTESERWALVHNVGFNNTYEYAQWQLEVFIWRSEALKSIELNFANCYCTSGCCRAVNKAMGIIFETGHYRWPDHVRVLGTKTRAERDYLLAIVACRYVNEGPNTIVFEKFEAGQDMVDPHWGRQKFWGSLIEEGLDPDLEREELRFEDAVEDEEPSKQE